jgi:hypothetical protein
MNVVNVEVTRSKDLQKLAKNKIWKFEKKSFSLPVRNVGCGYLI